MILLQIISIFVFIVVGFITLTKGVSSPTSSKVVLSSRVIYSKIILLGDVMLGRTVMTTSLDKNDINYPFLKVAGTLNEADLVFANLENPIIKDCPRHIDGFKFCAGSSQAKALKNAGIDVVTLANNHSANWGNDGLIQTKRYLDENDISYVGLGNLVVKKIGDTKFGFLGFDYVDNKLASQDLDLVKTSDKQVDILVVGVHWGVEYQDKASKQQVMYANDLIKAGADIISGHHPHWVQNIERIDNKPVYYSLGNFIFDQMWSEKTKQGLAMRLTFSNRILVKEEKMSIYMKQWAQPEFVTN